MEQDKNSVISRTPPAPLAGCRTAVYLSTLYLASRDLTGMAGLVSQISEEEHAEG